MPVPKTSRTTQTARVGQPGNRQRLKGLRPSGPGTPSPSRGEESSVREQYHIAPVIFLVFWAAPSPCGLGSRSIARAEGPARPSPAVRVSGLTADDRCRGSLRLAMAYHCDRRGSGGRPGCLHASAMAQDDRIGLTSSRGSSTAAMGGRPSWRTRANKVRSNGTAPDWPCDFNASSPPTDLRRGCPGCQRERS
jgi:hypothetical protein